MIIYQDRYIYKDVYLIFNNPYYNYIKNNIKRCHLMLEENNQALIEKHLEKSPIGITGFDEITAGGLPKGRTTLVYGSAGSGKTLRPWSFLSGVPKITMNKESL